jgi:HAD superfamily hydrolase (TIGR01509 family)
MDGTLIDSRAYHWRAWEATMQAEGAPITFEQFASTFGQRNDSILRGWLGAAALPETIARIGAAKEAHYRELVAREGIELLPGVESWLRELHTQGWRQAIASAAPHANIAVIVEALGLAPLFSATTAAEDVTRGKPDPQVFLLAADRLQVPADRCIVVEDAPAGLEGARRAGMRCIGVRTTHPHLEADIVVDRLDQLPTDSFNRLI